MKTRFKKMLSLALTMILVLSAVPFSALTARAETTYAVGDIIEFGGYPQSRVTDANTVAALNAKVKDGDWVSYGYYSGNGEIGSMTQGDWMKYCDIYLNGNKYRGVKFTQYRPEKTIDVSDAQNAKQDDNGYSLNTNYWFIWESLHWRVLDQATGLVLCNSVIDAQPYNNLVYSRNSQYYNDAAYSKTLNEYSACSLRTWLNGSFYNASFTAEQKNKIKSTQLDNSPVTFVSSSANGTATTDPVFVLSYNDVKNSAYQFESDSNRKFYGTDYAKCQGVSIGSTTGHSDWWLRTPAAGTYNSMYVQYYGSPVQSNCKLYNAGVGVLPAITFKSGIVNSPYSVSCSHSETAFFNNGDGTHSKKCAFCDLPLDEPAPHRMGRNMSVSNVGHYTDCPDCGVRFTYAHDDKGSVTTIPGTCVTPGQIKYHCSVAYCSYFGRTEETGLDAANHAGPYTDQEAVAATCTMQGSTRGQFCTACNQWKTAPQATDPDPANHVNTTDVPETDSTCIAHGYTAGVYCNDCEQWISGHEEKNFVDHVWSETGTVTKPATCSEPGETTYTCTVEGCGATETRTDIETDAGNHAGGTRTADEEIVPGTCIAVKTWNEVTYCAACGAPLSTEPKTGETDPANHMNTVDVPETDSTCIAHGYTAGVWCSDCQTYISGHEEKPFADHAWNGGENVKAATCTEQGDTKYTCTVPGCSATETRTDVPVDPDAHDFMATVTPPTCTEGGFTAHLCARCGAVYTDEETDALGHSWGEPFWKWNGAKAEAVFVCDVCGGKETVKAEVSAQTVTAPTETETGKAVYTATVTFDGSTYTDAVEKTLPPAGKSLCPWCGEYHDVRHLSGWITSFLHDILFTLKKLTQFVTLQW